MRALPPAVGQAEAHVRGSDGRGRHRGVEVEAQVVAAAGLPERFRERREKCVGDARPRTFDVLRVSDGRDILLTVPVDVYIQRLDGPTSALVAKTSVF